MGAQANWDTARQSCESENAVLVTIGNSDENDFVSSLSNANFWIGLNDISQEGVYVWVSGSTSTYRNWGTGEPNNSGDEDCTHMISSSTFWNDWPCTRSTPYVCEKGQQTFVVQCFPYIFHMLLIFHCIIGFIPCANNICLINQNN